MKADSCWSCLVVIEKGTKTCPLCGADQTPPAPISPAEAAILSDSRPSALRWVLPVAALLCGLGAAGIWYAARANDSAPATPEAAATSALQNIRVALSEYAIAHSDQYPPTLETLGAKAAAPVQDAKIAGYVVQYEALPSGDDKIPGFKLLGQPENSNGRRFYIDQSGVLRATPENRPARIDDPPA